MKSTFIISNDEADSYLPGYEVTCIFKMPEGNDSHVNLEFTQEESDEERHILLECEESSIDAVYNRVCDSLINNPHVIDLRGLMVTVKLCG